MSDMMILQVRFKQDNLNCKFIIFCILQTVLYLCSCIDLIVDFSLIANLQIISNLDLFYIL